jgi:glucosamine 6-phosphate synthetase-like amidotransferase/phosphosugar isomerase protein
MSTFFNLYTKGSQKIRRIQMNTWIKKSASIVIIAAFLLTQSGLGIRPAYALRAKAAGENGVAAAIGKAIGVDNQPAAAVAAAQVSNETMAGLEGRLLDCAAELMHKADLDPGVFDNATTADLALMMVEHLHSTGEEVAIGNIPSVKQARRILSRLEGSNVDWSTCGVHAAVQAKEMAADLSRTRQAVAVQRLYQAMALVADLHTFGKINTRTSGPLWNRRQLVQNSAYAIIAADRAITRLVSAPSENPQSLMAFRMTADQLMQAVQTGTPVIAWVGQNGNRDHFVLVTGYDEKTGKISYVETNVLSTVMPQGTEHSVTPGDFFKMWSQDGEGVVLCASPEIAHSGLLTAKEAAGILGACGVVTAAVRQRGIPKVLEGLFRMSYRAPDNTGLSVMTEDGIKIVKVVGKPNILIGKMYRDPMYKEDNPREGTGSVTDEQIETDRANLLAEEGLSAQQRTNLSGKSRENLYEVDEQGQPIDPSKRVTIGLGSVGSPRSTRTYEIDANLQCISKVANDYGLSLAYALLFVRFELEKRLKLAGLSDSEAEKILKTFDRIGEQVVLGNATEQDSNEWGNIYSDYLSAGAENIKGKEASVSRIHVTPDYDIDLVRHAFRLQGAIIGTFMVNPRWKKAVEAIFAERVKGTRLGGTDWESTWREEKRLNMTGQAFAAFVEWFQKTRLPKGLVRSGKVTLGVLDSYTAEVMTERIGSHGRWGMFGYIYEISAHPHADSGYTTNGVSQRFIEHNGSISTPIYERLRAEMEDEGYKFKTGVDSELAIIFVEKVFNDFMAGALTPEREERWRRVVANTAQRTGQNLDWLLDFSKKDLVAYTPQRKAMVDEIASRVAMIEMSERSEIGASIYTAHNPFTEYVVGHDRPIYVVVHNGEYMVTSDYNAALGMWPARQVEEAVKKIKAINNNLEKIVKYLRDLRKAAEAKDQSAHDAVWQEIKADTEKEVRDFFTPISADQFVTESEFRYQVKKAADRAVLRVGEIEKDFQADVYFLDGKNKFATVSREIGADGKQSVRVNVTTLDGTAVDAKQAASRPVTINPVQADKTGYQWFMNKHIAETPTIFLRNIFRYIPYIERLAIDVVELTNGVRTNKPLPGGVGGISFAQSGPGVGQEGNNPDLYADIIVAWVKPERMREFNPKFGGKPIDPDVEPRYRDLQGTSYETLITPENRDQFINPDEHAEAYEEGLYQTMKTLYLRIAEAADRKLNDYCIYTMARAREHARYRVLERLQKEYKGLDVVYVTDGTVAPALAATVDRRMIGSDGREKYILEHTVGGAPEGLGNLATARQFPGALLGLRMYSTQINKGEIELEREREAERLTRELEQTENSILWNAGAVSQRDAYRHEIEAQLDDIKDARQRATRLGEIVEETLSAADLQSLSNAEARSLFVRVQVLTEMAQEAAIATVPRSGVQGYKEAVSRLEEAEAPFDIDVAQRVVDSVTKKTLRLAWQPAQETHKKVSKARDALRQKIIDTLEGNDKQMRDSAVDAAKNADTARKSAEKRRKIIAEEKKKPVEEARWRLFVAKRDGDEAAITKAQAEFDAKMAEYQEAYEPGYAGEDLRHRYDFTAKEAALLVELRTNVEVDGEIVNDSADVIAGKLFTVFDVTSSVETSVAIITDNLGLFVIPGQDRIPGVKKGVTQAEFEAMPKELQNLVDMSLGTDQDGNPIYELYTMRFKGGHCWIERKRGSEEDLTQGLETVPVEVILPDYLPMYQNLTPAERQSVLQEIGYLRAEESFVVPVTQTATMWLSRDNLIGLETYAKALEKQHQGDPQAAKKIVYDMMVDLSERSGLAIPSFDDTPKDWINDAIDEHARNAIDSTIHRKRLVATIMNSEGGFRDELGLRAFDAGEIVEGYEDTVNILAPQNVKALRGVFGPNLEELRRVYLVGVGSSWRDAICANPVFEETLPGVEIIPCEPSDLATLGVDIDPAHDLFIGISWSGTTSATLKIMQSLQRKGALCMTITGKPQSDMGRLTENTGGTIDVQSGIENTITTYKGFAAILQCLDLLAVQMGDLRGTEREISEQYVADQMRMSEYTTNILESGALNDAAKEVAAVCQDTYSFLMLGSRANPIIHEMELKVEEEVHIVGAGLDVDDASWRTTVEKSLKAGKKVMVGVNMTSAARLDDMMEAVRWLISVGAHVAVQTFSEEDGNKYLKELQQIREETTVAEPVKIVSDEEIQTHRLILNIVPKLRPTLQAMVDMPFGIMLSVLWAEEFRRDIDNPRNLAKSVVVSGMQEALDLIKETKAELASPLQFVQTRDAGQEEAALSAYGGQLQGQWQQGAVDARTKATQRLPFAFKSALQSVLGDGFNVDLETLQARFGKGLEGLKRVVVITDEETTENAAKAAQFPLGSRERVATGKDIYNKPVDFPLAGQYIRIAYDAGADAFAINELDRSEGGALTINEAAPAITVNHETKTVTINGKVFEVTIDADRQEGDGLVLRAVNPNILGVDVEVRRSVDENIARNIDPATTLVVAVHRSNDRHAKNDEIQDIADPVAGRTQLALAGDERSADMMEQALKSVPEDALLVSISDTASPVAAMAKERGGNISVDDLDDVNLYGVTYTALLGLGVQLAQLKAAETPSYQTLLGAYRQSLQMVPDLARQSAADEATLEQIRQILPVAARYEKVHIIGGGQALADAQEMARQLRMLGITAEALPNDSAWHGPLASVDPNPKKFTQTNEFDPEYGVRDDTLIIFMATDSKFYQSALTDVKVYDTRQARFIIIAKQTDATSQAVQKLAESRGCLGVLATPDCPDELTNLANAPLLNNFARMFAEKNAEYYPAEAKAAAFGKPVAPTTAGTAGIVRAPVVTAPAARVQPAKSVTVTQLPQIQTLAYNLRQIGTSGVAPTNEEIIAGIRERQLAALVIDPECDDVETAQEWVDLYTGKGFARVLTAVSEQDAEQRGLFATPNLVLVLHHPSVELNANAIAQGVVVAPMELNTPDETVMQVLGDV